MSWEEGGFIYNGLDELQIGGDGFLSIYGF